MGSLKTLDKKVKVGIAFALILIISSIVLYRNINKSIEHVIIENESFLPDVEVFRRIQVKDKKYLLLTFFSNYCEGCREGVRRKNLNVLACKYYKDLEVVGIFKNYSKKDLDNLKRIYRFSFQLLPSPETFVFKQKKSSLFVINPLSILVDQTGKVIFMEDKNNTIIDLLKILSGGKK